MNEENSVRQQKDVMTALKNRKKGKKRIIIIAIVVIVILLFFYVKQSMEKAMVTVQETLTQMQTDEVSKRSLIKSIGATGTVVSVKSKDVKTELAGAEIKEILVEIGDSVAEGQKLVVFDTSDIEENLEYAMEQLDVAEQRNSLTRNDAKRNVENAQRSEQYQVDMAKTSMDKAQNNYEDAKKDYNNGATALNNLRKNENDINIKYQNTKKDMEGLATNLAEKETLVNEAETTLKEMDSVSSGNASGYKTALEKYNKAVEERDSALTEYNDKYEKLAAEAVALENQYAQAKASREAQEKVVNGLADTYIAMTDAYNSSVKSYDNTVATQASSVESAKSNQKSTTLSMDTSTQEKQVEQYQEQLEKASLTAPFAGIVTAVNYEEGDTYAQGAVVTIQDCSAFEIEAEIGEYDISDIKLGQKVLIKTDATRDEELNGTVIFISPTATNIAMSTAGVTYKVRISVDTPNDRLRLDMSASLSIIIEEHEDVYTVPYNAVQEDEDGNAFIELIGEDGITTTKLPVTVVMESSYYTEIAADGLEEGMKIKVIESEEDMMFELMMGGGF
ncbi:MAG: efflux RND transporter periplasmic adaptor subunit [Lachnospiraceae bacterium]|nr:efflux RND transporter periplasmic adaptor subunit [Lachnospiraceae bacterium]